MGIKNTLEKFGLIEKNPDSTEASFEEAAVATVMEEVPAVQEPVVEKEQAKKKEQKPEAVDFTRLEFLTLKEIYKKYHKEAEGINSLFIVEKFSDALPGYLPQDVKRESVLNIITTSGMKLNYLLEDGQQRLRNLEEYSQSFTSQAQDAIAKHEAEIKQLNEKITRCKKAMAEIEKTQKEQAAIIEYELERINNIIEFINPKNSI